MVVVPGVIPSSKPVVLPMVAISVFELLQIPPLAVSLRLMVLPAHSNAPVPEIGEGCELTVTVAIE